MPIRGQRLAQHLRQWRSNCTRATVSQVTSTPLFSEGARGFPRLQEAWGAVRGLPEVASARDSGAPALAGAELARARVVLEQARAPSATVAVAAHLEALNLHARGHVKAELKARDATIAALADAHELGDEREPLVAAAAAGAAVAAMRGHDVEAVAVRAARAGQMADVSHVRLVAELAAGAAERDDVSACARLSAVAALAAPTAASDVDVGGLARGMAAVRDRKNGHEHAVALVVRWDATRPATFDYVEALVGAGRAVARQTDGEEDVERRKRLFTQAEDYLSKGLEVSGTIGNELDKAEALLAIAQLYARHGNIVEAEGLFRSVEERFAKPIARDCISVAAASVYVRTMDAYARFLENSEFAGRKRTREAETARSKRDHVQSVFEEILQAPSVAPLWIVDSVIGSLELPLEDDN